MFNKSIIVTATHALPAASLGNLLHSNTLRMALASRLGCPICPEHTCRCGNKVDPSGTHGLSCRYSAGRHSRHTEINNINQRGLCSAGFPSIRKPAGMSRADGRRPDVQILIPFEQGRILIWDFTAVDPVSCYLHPAYQRGTRKSCGAGGDEETEQA